MSDRSRSTKRGAAVVALLLAFGILPSVAGDLEAPGSPAPTMLPLGDVEARIPIRPADLPLTITQSGSYYLTGSASVADYGIIIAVNVSDVTIDLNGFTLSGGSFSGIQCGNPTGSIRIHDGLIVGFQDGISCINTTGLEVERVVAADNTGSCRYRGTSIPRSTTTCRMKK